MRVPNGWTKQKIGDVCQPNSESVSVAPDRTYKLMGVRWYGNGPHLHSEVEGEKLNTKTLNVVKAGQITYNRMWVSKSAFGIVAAEHDGIFATAEYPTFTPGPNLHGDFLRHYMKLDSFRAQALSRCRGTTSRARLNPKDFLDLEIFLPPFPEQRRIAEILTSVDEAIEATQTIIEQTCKVKQGVLTRLLTKGIGHVRFKATEIGAVPETWRLKPLGELCSLTNGNGFRPPDWTDHGLPIIRIQNLNGSKVFNHFAGTPKAKWIVEPGDLLFSWAGVRGVSFGPCIWDSPRGVLNQHIFKVHPSPEVNQFWLFLAMTLVTARIEAKAHGFKASLLHVHKSEITNQLIAVPPEGEQKEIVCRLDALSLSERSSKDTLAKLEETKAALQSDLLLGQKRVPIGYLAATE
jgi:type I restriction enzyme, S subunit